MFFIISQFEHSCSLQLADAFVAKHSPLLVMLHFVDPNVPLFGDEETSITPPHQLANLADLFDYCTHGNQLILAKQLIEHGVSVNAVSIPRGNTPLHRACSSRVVTDLDFVECLLKSRCRSQSGTDTVDVYHSVCSRCGLLFC
jgi:hypothetical protein